MAIAGLLAASVIVLPALDDSTAMRRIMERYPQEAASSGVSGPSMSNMS
ncbi:hypothetical protein GRI97_07265 [Altererythrobacter xixiisoli]|uniref:Uncharacterized protein n=2 Tax=Croceibacterium xixiisoli TaxID=1476466 RepID=A0A6I4TSA4_9SPHN|nr:hypothetical protein [Croceibacterium xixiisoli]